MAFGTESLVAILWRLHKIVVYLRPHIEISDKYFADTNKFFLVNVRSFWSNSNTLIRLCVVTGFPRVGHVFRQFLATKAAAFRIRFPCYVPHNQRNLVILPLLIADRMD